MKKTAHKIILSSAMLLLLSGAVAPSAVAFASTVNRTSPKIETRDTGQTTYKETVVSSTRKNNIWVGYHSGTPNWSKASSYTITAGKSFSVSGSYNYEGLNVGIGFSYQKTIATSIPANSGRYSRLGVRGDFTFKKIKRQYYVDGVAWGKPSYRVTSVRHNYYLAPVYK